MTYTSVPDWQSVFIKVKRRGTVIGYRPPLDTYYTFRHQEHKGEKYFLDQLVNRGVITREYDEDHDLPLFKMIKNIDDPAWSEDELLIKFRSNAAGYYYPHRGMYHKEKHILEALVKKGMIEEVRNWDPPTFKLKEEYFNEDSMKLSAFGEQMLQRLFVDKNTKWWPRRDGTNLELTKELVEKGIVRRDTSLNYTSESVAPFVLTNKGLQVLSNIGKSSRSLGEIADEGVSEQAEEYLAQREEDKALLIELMVRESPDGTFKADSDMMDLVLELERDGRLTRPWKDSYPYICVPKRPRE